MRQGNSTKAEYYNRRQVNFKPEPPKRGLKQYHPMGDFEYYPPEINMHHQPGEGVVTKGILIPAYAISVYLLILSIACLVVSFNWCNSKKNQKAQDCLELFFVYTRIIFIKYILFLLQFLDFWFCRFNLSFRFLIISLLHQIPAYRHIGLLFKIFVLLIM